MIEDLLSHQATIRLGGFAGIFAAMALWELLAPRRKQAFRRSSRWPSNLGVVVLDTLLVRLAFPTTAVGVALLAEQHGWGLFHVLTMPVWLTVVVAVILLDLAIYLQHVLFHAVPALWRLHRMHHADLDFDVTTGVRFHPVEILLSMGSSLAWSPRSARRPLAVLIFEVLLNATSMFNHGNVRLPARRRPRAALDRRHARHAPRPPFGRAARDQQQFRLQSALVGPAVRHLPRRSRRRGTRR